MNELQREYTLNHWKEYNLTDTKEEFIALLNILEALNETLDSLHDVVINGGCCGTSIQDTWESDKEVVESLFYFSSFMTVEELKGFLYERLEDYEGMDEAFKESYIDCKYSDCQIEKTHDGYVVTIAC